MTAPAPLVPPASARLPRHFRFFLGLIFAACFVQFWHHTTPVRLATSDDVVFQQIVDASDVDAYLTQNALDQGRFYFATPLLMQLFALAYRLESPAAFSFLRAAVFFTQIGLAGWLLARVTRSATWGSTLALGLASLMHLPLTFFPVLSCLPMACGFAAVLLALHFHLTQLDQPSWWAGLLAGVFCLTACLTQEIFVLFLPLFFVLSWTRGHRPWSRVNLTPAVAVAGFLVVYVLFARIYPSTYGGTQLSFNLPAVGQVLSRQLFGVAPGFELILQRPLTGEFVPWLRPGAQIAGILMAIRWPDLLLAVAEAAALLALLVHASRQAVPCARMVSWAVAFAVLINLPVAFSVKYQVFLMQRTFPYMYAFHALFFLAVAGLGLVVMGLRLPWVRLHLPGVGVLLGIGLLALCVSAAASNRHTLQILAGMYNR